MQPVGVMMVLGFHDDVVGLRQRMQHVVIGNRAVPDHESAVLLREVPLVQVAVGSKLPFILHMAERGTQGLHWIVTVIQGAGAAKPEVGYGSGTAPPRHCKAAYGLVGVAEDHKALASVGRDHIIIRPCLCHHRTS